MSALSINIPFPVFTDREGNPLEAGYVWIGEPYLNAQSNPVAVYFDDALTIPAPQPLRTLNGYVSRQGSPAQLYIDGVNFSILVQDKKGTPVYSFDDGTGISPDASGVTYLPAGTGAVATTVQSKLLESVSVKDFGAVGDGITDDTAAFILANEESLTLNAPSGTYNLTNWVPREGTTLAAHGAVIQRSAGTTYALTGSSAAIVVTSNGITLLGGRVTDKPGLMQATFSGGILIDGGDNLSLQGIELTGMWAGVFGNLAQTGTNVGKDVVLDSCWVHDNQHNTYLADIDGMLVNGCVLERADRDGIKTYRNVKNISITNNIIRDNGDGTVGQSRDGIDIYIAGHTVIIANNFIYGNAVKGIDIKRNMAGEPDLLENHRIIITGNHIYENADIGVQCEVVDGVGYIENVSVVGNHIYSNGGRGVYCTYVRGLDISHNNIYSNTTDGVRVDNVDYARITENYVTANSVTGINCVSGNAIKVTGNQVVGGTQSNGILMLAALTYSTCRDNNSTGHPGVNYQAYGSALGVKGKVLVAPITNTTNSQFIGFSDKGSTAGIEIMLNNTATADVIVSKRSETTGLNVGSITANTGVVFVTPNVTVNQTITGSNSLRNLAGNNALVLTLANITSGFTSGYIKLHYID